MKVLIFCAHPDDEVIGMAGTIKKLSNAGAQIRLVVVSEGAEGYTRVEDRDTIVVQRDAETRAACAVLGISEYINLHWLDWDIRVGNALYRALIGQIRDFQPDLLFTHCYADYHDHHAVHTNVEEAWFHAGLPCAMEDTPTWPMAPLYEFEVVHRMPSPSVIVDITETYAAKVEAMSCYASQFDIVGGVFQMLEGRALERGSMIGVKYGEALLRNHYRPTAVRDAAALACRDVAIL